MKAILWSVLAILAGLAVMLLLIIAVEVVTGAMYHCRRTSKGRKKRCVRTSRAIRNGY